MVTILILFTFVINTSNIAKAKKTAMLRPTVFFLHSCSDNCSATFLKILGPGHQRSRHQVRSSDPTSEKLSNRVTATAGKRKI